MSFHTPPPLVRFKNHDNTDVYININNISSLTESEVEEHACIYCWGEQGFYEVKHTMDEVIRMISTHAEE